MFFYFIIHYFTFIFIYEGLKDLFKEIELILFADTMKCQCSRYTFLYVVVYVNKTRFLPIPAPRECPCINQTPYLQRYQAWWVLLSILSVVVRVAHRATLVQVRRSASQRTMPFIARNFLETSTDTRTFYRVSAMEYTVI